MTRQMPGFLFLPPGPAGSAEDRFPWFFRVRHPQGDAPPALLPKMAPEADGGETAAFGLPSCRTFFRKRWPAETPAERAT